MIYLQGESFLHIPQRSAVQAPVYTESPVIIIDVIPALPKVRMVLGAYGLRLLRNKISPRNWKNRFSVTDLEFVVNSSS